MSQLRNSPELQSRGISRGSRYTGLLIRCSEIVNRVDSDLLSSQYVQDKALFVEIVRDSNKAITRDELQLVGRVLALQLGMTIHISCVEPSVASPLVRETASFENVLPILTPTTSLALVVEPTVFTVLHNTPFSNFYESIPQDILSRMFAENVYGAAGADIQPTKDSSFADIRTIFDRHYFSMKDWRVHRFAGFTHILINEEPSIIEVPEFYELTRELKGIQVPGRPVVVTIAPRRIQEELVAATPEVESTQLPQLYTPMFLETDQVSFVTEHRPSQQQCEWSQRLLFEFGTHHPYTITAASDYSSLAVNVLFQGKRDTSSHGQVAAIRESVSRSEIPISVGVIPVSRATVLRNGSERPSISYDDLCDMAALVRKNLLISGDSQWARVTPDSSECGIHGNCIEITPKVKLCRGLLDKIKSAAALVPAPVVVHHLATEPCPLELPEIRALTKLLLPPSASLVNITSSGHAQVKIRISASESQWSDVKKSLRPITSSVNPEHQAIILGRAARSVELEKAIEEVSDSFRSHFLRHMTEDGYIPLKSWNPPGRKYYGQVGDSIESLLDYYPQIIDRRDLQVSLWDSQGTTRAEDGFSFELTDRVLTYGMHFANAAILLGEFSEARRRAYRHGDSVYQRQGERVGISHMLPGASRYTFKPGRDTPAVSVFFDFNLDELDNFESLAQSISNARYEATLVRPTSVRHYPREWNDTWQQQIPKSAHVEMEYIRTIAQAVARHQDHLGIASLSVDQLHVSEQIAIIMDLTNHVIAKRIHDSGLPCLYHVSPPFSLKSGLAFCQMLDRAAELGIHELRPFNGMTPQDFIEGGMWVRKLVQIVSRLPFKLKKELGVPRIVETISLAPAAHATSGYDTFVRANSGFRKVVSLVAQHQLNAQLGLIPPLSRGEISALYAQQLQQQKHSVHERVRSDLRLVTALNEFKSFGNEPFRVVVEGSPHHGAVWVRPTLPFQLPFRCQVRLDSDDNSPVSPGDLLHAVVEGYSLSERKFILKRVKPQ